MRQASTRAATHLGVTPSRPSQKSRVVAPRPISAIGRKNREASPPSGSAAEAHPSNLPAGAAHRKRRLTHLADAQPDRSNHVCGEERDSRPAMPQRGYGISPNTDPEYAIEVVDSLKRQLKQEKEAAYTLKAAMHRLEGEVAKRDRQIETLLSTKFSTFTPTVESIRAAHEKSSVIQSLYKQIRELRGEVDRRGEELGRLAQSHKASTLMELVVEKEEYLAEVVRLRAHVREQAERLASERQMARHLRQMLGASQGPPVPRGAGNLGEAFSSDEDEEGALTPAWPSPHPNQHSSMCMENPEMEGGEGVGSPCVSPPRHLPSEENELGRGWPGRRQSDGARYEGRRRQVEEEEEVMWARLMPSKRAPGTSPPKLPRPPSAGVKGEKKRRALAKKGTGTPMRRRARAGAKHKAVATSPRSENTVQVSLLSPHMETQGFYREAEGRGSLAKEWQGRREVHRERKDRTPSPPRVPKSPAGFARHVERSREAKTPQTTRATEGRKSPGTGSRKAAQKSPSRGASADAVVAKPPTLGTQALAAVEAPTSPPVVPSRPSMDEAAACVKIQAVMRGYQTRHKVGNDVLGRSVTKVQALYRGHRDRRLIKRRREVAEVHGEAVVRLQAAYRGFYTRTHKPEPTQGPNRTPLNKAAPHSPVLQPPAVVVPTRAQVGDEQGPRPLVVRESHVTPHRPEGSQHAGGKGGQEQEAPAARSPEPVTIRRLGEAESGTLEVVRGTAQAPREEAKPREREGRKPPRPRQQDEDTGRGQEDQQADAGQAQAEPSTSTSADPSAREGGGQEGSTGRSAASTFSEGSAMGLLPPRNTRVPSNADAPIEVGQGQQIREGKGRRASVSAKEAMAVAMQGLMGEEEEEGEGAGGYSNDDFESEDGGA